MKIVDLGDQIFREISDDSLAIPSICYWIRGNIGQLNIYTYQNFCIDSNSLEIKNCFGPDEAAIMKIMYSIHYFKSQALKYLGAAGVTTSLSITSDGATAKFYDKNQLAKTFLGLVKQQEEILENVVGAYRILRASPIQVASDDTSSSYLPAGYFNDLYRTKYAD